MVSLIRLINAIFAGPIFFKFVLSFMYYDILEGYHWWLLVNSIHQPLWRSNVT